MMTAPYFYRMSGRELLGQSPETISQAIADGQYRRTSFAVEQSQYLAWLSEAESLKSIAENFPDCTLAFEYMIPRMGKRVDVVVLIDSYVFILEYKVGASTFTSQALDQIIDYAFDLKNFHHASHDCWIFPVLVCTQAQSYALSLRERSDGIYEAQETDSTNLLHTLNSVIAKITIRNDLDHDTWLNSEYSPTPTIIEAAQALYQSHTVDEISRHEAKLTDINKTTSCVDEIVEYSKQNHRKSICFITGVPGAGKTMVGLNLAATRRDQDVTKDHAVFLSGNGPLIEVLQNALAENRIAIHKEHCKDCNHVYRSISCKGCDSFSHKKGEAMSEVKAFVQGVHLFREEYFETDTPPHEHIAVFDEAQRAWAETQLSRKMKTRWINKHDDVVQSEPDCLIDYMDRHEDWAVMVCLVGGGQEINDGEAGISEWFRSLKENHQNWDIFISDEISYSDYTEGQAIWSVFPEAHVRDNLHLSVDMRSFRNIHVADFAEALIDENPEKASQLYPKIIENYPIYVTRDLCEAKKWALAQTVRPSDRCGLIANSHGERIRADGVIVPAEGFRAVKWFLRGRDDCDSSYYMEIAASEFKIQGLEIDYAVVAWEADYRYGDDGFSYHSFRGEKWQNINSEEQRRYLKNGYRVLLTRARQGFVLYVPEGSERDKTRPTRFYDGTYHYLKKVGIKDLPLSPTVPIN